MIKITLLILATLFFSGCVNKHGISAKYYSDCKEYYDLQGYYHKECGEDDIVTYKEIGEAGGKVIDTWTGNKPKPKGNVW
ncbi:hypothetical protein SMGD1_1889 [Sulfurimonas gotlandica GD1]|jgi:hypothetical protein|uniref:Lipoprotein n=1 Tax=Sulfurimonas gotlandica (strain DSM 19862 / JCM 16533 / GD1) TaxID=929558 RepID=B6BIQ4_SULGG|nr:hypothetical protein [Sulfurimonas gotlandica]EDZ63166.1 conserved hypothetical protein [Sulfurimonas gotlandica GD1]EHP30412.1 hypothetical protein SMGD1_1889 [Sulfurimonas gotlandica GD1]